MLKWNDVIPFIFFVDILKMALSSNPGFLNDTQDNYANATLKHSLLTAPVVAPQTVQSNIPWKYEKIELLDSFVYKQNDTIRFSLPRNGLLDPRSLRLSFQVRGLIDGAATPTTLYQVMFAFDMNSIFSRCTIKCSNQQIISDIEPYNVLSRTISKLANEYQMSQTQRCMYSGMGLSTAGFDPTGTGNQRQVYHSPQYVSRPQPLAITRRYMVNVNQGLFAQQKPIFLDAFYNDLVLEFKLDRPSVSTIFGTTSLSLSTTPLPYVSMIEVGNPTLHFTRYLPTPSLQRELSIGLDTSKLGYQFHGHDYFRYPIQAQTKKHVFKIPISRKWLKYAVAFIRCDADRDNSLYSSFRTYASIDPNVNFVLTSSIPLAAKYAKQSTVQHYFWKYGMQSIPEKPVRVSNTTPVFYDTNGAIVTGPANTATQRFDYSVHQYNHVTPGVEAWYMVEQLFLRHKELQMQLYQPAVEATFLPIDPISPYAILGNGGYDDGAATSAIVNGQTSPAVLGRIPSHFMMVGLFSESAYEGYMNALSGGIENESLELHFECVGISENPVPETRMYLEVFVAYDNVMQLTSNGILLTN